MLEPCAFNGARTVLRGLGDGDIPWLLDVLKQEAERSECWAVMVRMLGETFPASYGFSEVFIHVNTGGIRWK